MQVDLYKSTSDNNTIGKALTVVSTVDATIKAPCTIENPSIVLHYNEQLKDVNYMYIPYFGRYYFVTGRELLNGERVVFNLAVDVLESFKNDILNVSAVIDRQENKFNAYMVDNEYICDNKSTVETKKFTGSFSTDLSLYLTVRGN